jgi:hypothetical protein
VNNPVCHCREALVQNKFYQQDSNYVCWHGQRDQNVIRSDQKTAPTAPSVLYLPKCGQMRDGFLMSQL